MTKTITSPVGEVVFAALRTPVKNKYKQDKEEYMIRLLFTENTKGASEFRSQMQSISPSKVVTSVKPGTQIHTTLEGILGKGVLDEHGNLPRGSFMVGVSSKKAPTITDQNGDRLIDVPTFPRGTRATAVITASPFKSEVGSTALLNGVAILTYDTSNVEQTEATPQSLSLKELREAIAKVKGQ